MHCRSLLSFFLVALLLVLGACTKGTDAAPGINYLKRDRATITDYIRVNDLTGFQQIDTTGVYVAVTRPGTGPLAQGGQTLTAKYQGTTLDGLVFDQSKEAVDGFPFKLGAREVIPGWDLAFRQLNAGSQATLLIASPQGYGPNQVGPVPPNSVLRFDVELLQIQ